MPTKAKLKYWKATQEHWNDDEFLGAQANAFMKLRWKRLKERCAGEAASCSAVLGRPLDLVDVGCAHADFYDAAKKSLRSYTGIEPSKALLPKNVSKGKAFKLVRGTAEKLPLKAQSADFVLIKEVLDHCFDPQKVVREAFRVLRPGGELLITLTNDHAWYKLLMPASAARIKAGQHDHLYFFHPEQVLKLCRDAGFKIVSEQSSHYLRLPYAVESLVGGLPEFIPRSLIFCSDAVGGLTAPGYGGSFWVSALK